MTNRRSERGAILIIVMIMIMVVAGMSAALLHVAMAQAQTAENAWYQAKALELAETGIDRGRSLLQGSPPSGVPTSNGTAWSSLLSATGGTGAWNPTNDDVGLDGVASTSDYGENDGYPTPLYAARGAAAPGEPNITPVALGTVNSVGAADDHTWTLYARWWGGDGVDNNNDGQVDTDINETRTYTIRAAGLYQGQYAELESVLTRDPPQPPINPNSPPAGMLSAISIQIAAGGYTGGANNVNVFNPSAANSVSGFDNPTSISGAQAPSSTNNTVGVQLAANGASLSLTSNNTSGVTGTGGTPSFNNSGSYIGNIVDTIADGVKLAARDTSGNPSSDANNQSLGSASNLRLVYHDADANGQLTIGGTTGPGYGILVVDVTNASSPPLQFSGSNSTWEGVVIVRIKGTATTNTNGFVKAVGAGATPGQIGSVIVYAKGAVNYGAGSDDFYKNNGNRTTQFSMGAVKAALTAFNNQVPPPPAQALVTPLTWRPVRVPGSRWVQAGE